MPARIYHEVRIGDRMWTGTDDEVASGVNQVSIERDYGDT